MSKLMPRQPVPDLAVPLVAGGEWRLADQSPEHFTLISFYRGLHCPICKTYTRELDRLAGDFAELGVETITLSSDVEERAKRAVDEWELENLSVGYGLALDKAREWGLYISSGIGTSSVGIVEPERFSEPGVFAVRPDGTLYMASVNTMPFARTHFKDILGAMKIILEKDYPARGEA